MKAPRGYSDAQSCGISKAVQKRVHLYLLLMTNAMFLHTNVNSSASVTTWRNARLQIALIAFWVYTKRHCHFATTFVVVTQHLTLNKHEQRLCGVDQQKSMKEKLAANDHILVKQFGSRKGVFSAPALGLFTRIWP